MREGDKMVQGLPYRSWLDGLPEARQAVRRKLLEYNALDPADYEAMEKLLRQILGSAGKDPFIQAPFYCDYGSNIHLGDYFYANFNWTVLDGARVSIGHHCMIGPNVGFYGASHPLHFEKRIAGYEHSGEITIGNNVWIGGHVVINGDVTIGDNTVVASGSVVTKDLPADSLCVGNPCRVLRPITAEDAKYYKKRIPWPED